jgi:hypothetical protein
MATEKSSVIKDIILPLFGALITVNTSYLVYKINQIDELTTRVSVIETKLEYIGNKPTAALFKHEDFYTFKPIIEDEK